MSVTGSMTFRITLCGRLSLFLRCCVVATLIRATAFIASYQLLLNFEGDSLVMAMYRNAEAFRVDIKDGLSIIEVSKDA